MVAGGGAVNNRFLPEPNAIERWTTRETPLLTVVSPVVRIVCIRVELYRERGLIVLLAA